MEAFSDGVIAIIITIMVLELKVPHDASLRALVPVAPVFLSYVLSFVFIGIYWSNHHHLLQVVEHEPPLRGHALADRHALALHADRAQTIHVIDLQDRVLLYHPEQHQDTKR